jgi:hypothetical protein
MTVGIGRPDGRRNIVDYVLEVRRYSSMHASSLTSHTRTYQHGLTSAATLRCQDFGKEEWEEMQFGISDTLDIVKAVLVEGMDRAISGVRA